MVDFHERETTAGHGSLDEETATADEEEPSEGGGGPDDHHHHDSDHHAGHDHHAHDVDAVGAAVVTVSSTRSLESDPSGDAIAQAFESAGHEVATRELVADDLDGVQGRVDTLVSREDVDVVVTTGGTGVTPDDVTVEAVRPLFEKTLPGFGELFRQRSEAEIGTRVVATRATAGIADGIPVFCMPGSESAVRLGMREIILPEVGHLAGLATREEDEE